jgi:hypothetical protein
MERWRERANRGQVRIRAHVSFCEARLAVKNVNRRFGDFRGKLRQLDGQAKQFFPEGPRHRAAQMMRQVIGQSPSAKTTERRTRRVGAEKNSSFERTKAPADSSEDPCATLPDTFHGVAHFGMPMKREDGRLQDYLWHRPGYVFTRRPPPVVAM